MNEPCPHCSPHCICVEAPDGRCGDGGEHDRCDSQCCLPCRNEAERMRAVSGRWSARAYWARIGYDKAIAHRFTTGEISGSYHGSACGLWALRGGVPVAGARRCKRCEETTHDGR